MSRNEFQMNQEMRDVISQILASNVKSASFLEDFGFEIPGLKLEEFRI